MANFPLIQKDDKESIHRFSENCYEVYKDYMKIYSSPNRIVSLDEFQLEIFPDKEKMKEYLFEHHKHKKEYLMNYADIQEAFPFLEYQRAARREFRLGVGGELDTNGAGFVLYRKHSDLGQNPFSPFSAPGHDFSLIIPCKSDMSDFIDNFKEKVVHYDPEKEALNEGNGAPKSSIDSCWYKHFKNYAQAACKTIEEIVNAHNKSLTKKVTPKLVGKEFLRTVSRKLRFEKIVMHNPNPSFRELSNEAMIEFLFYENGNPTKRKDALNEYMIVELNIINGREETFKKGIEKGLLELEKPKLEKSKSKSDDYGIGR